MGQGSPRSETNHRRALRGWPGPNPLTVECDGTSYSRFHDFIYVSKQLEDLDEQQVVAVCTLRDEFATAQQLEPNRKIRQIFVDLVSTSSQRFYWSLDLEIVRC